MHKLIQRYEAESSFYPKVHARKDGTFTVVRSGGVGTVERFVMEPLTEVPEAETIFVSFGEHGAYYIIIPASGEVEVSTFFSTTYGSWFDGRMWVNTSLPEPTEVVEYPGLFEYASDYTYVLKDYPDGAEYDAAVFVANDNIHSPVNGIFISESDYASTDSDIVYSERELRGVFHYSGVGDYAFVVVNEAEVFAG